MHGKLPSTSKVFNTAAIIVVITVVLGRALVEVVRACYGL